MPRCGGYPAALCSWQRPAAAAPLTRLLKWRPLVRAGELSFSFYMIHQLVIRVMRRALYHWQLEWSTSLCIVVALTATIFATWVLHRLVEVPARRFLLRERP